MCRSCERHSKISSRLTSENETASPLAIIYAAKILFPKAEIAQKLDQLKTALDLYGKTKDGAVLSNTKEQIITELDNVTSALAKESNDK